MMRIKQIVETAKSALFICSICQENIKDPVLLTCNHSFCSICLKNYLSSSPVKNVKTYNCPNCSKTVTRRSSYSAPDIEGQLFKDLITILEAETGVDLTDVHAKDVPSTKYDKQRYIIQQKENNVTNKQKTKESSKNLKQFNNPETAETSPTKISTKRRTTAANRKRTLSNSKNDSASKRKKISDTKKNELEDVEINDSSSKRKITTVNNKKNGLKCDVEISDSSLERKVSTRNKKNVIKCDVEVSDSSLNTKNSGSLSNVEIISEKSENKQTADLFKWANSSSNSPSIKSFHVTEGGKMKTYQRKNKWHDNLPTSDVVSEEKINKLSEVEEWVVQQQTYLSKRSKSLTPMKKSRIVLPKNKSLNETISKSPTEIARNLESEVLNDLLQIAVPKTNSSKDNWTRVKREFRTPKFKKLDLSIVQPPSNRKSTRNKKTSKQSDIITITDESINDNKIKMTPKVTLEKFMGFNTDEQVRTKMNENKFLSTAENFGNSLKISKLAVDLIDQLTTQILNENVQFSSFFVFKQCVNISRKLRELSDLKEIETTNKSKLFKKEISTNTENYDNICSKCHLSNSNQLIDLTQKINPINSLSNTQQINKTKLNHESTQPLLQGQMSGDFFIETENENNDKVVANDSSNSESSLKFYTPKNVSNTSMLMQDVIHDMYDMELTQTIPTKDTVVDSTLKDQGETEIDNSPNILSNDDDDIIESTPKSNKSTTRVKRSKENVISPTQVYSQQHSLRSQRKKPESETEVSEDPSIVLGTEYTQKVPKQLKRKKRLSSVINNDLGTEYTKKVPEQLIRKKRLPSIDNDENKLDVTLIEPIETQPVNSIPVLMEIPPPTEFMDTEDDNNYENKSKRNNLNNFSVLPDATMLKNMKTPAAEINIQQLKENPILTEMSQNGPVTSIESVIEQTPLSCYPPKSRINLSNTKAFKQVYRQGVSTSEVSTSDSEPEDCPLEVVKDNTPRRLYNGPSNSKQLSILSYANVSQDKRGKLSASQVSDKKLSTSTPMKLLPSLPINMSSSQRRNSIMNESFKSQFDIPTTQSFARPMASSTPARPVMKTKSSLHRLESQRNMEIFWTRLSVSQINLLMDFCKQFNIRFTTDNTDTTTHLITRVDENNFVEDYTLKYVCSVARGIWVLSFKWIEDCLDNSKILPEEPYEVLDTTGNPGPRMSRLRDKSSMLLEKFAVCVVSSPETFPKDKLINCILQNGGTIYHTVEELASANQDGKIRLIIADTPETQDMHTFQDYFERYGILSIITEWVFNTIAIFRVESLVSYLVCSVADVPEEYPQELLIESEIMCDSMFER